MAKIQRNSPERATMLAARRVGQEARRGSLRMIGVAAWMNRRTGKPHEHNRQKARRLAS